MKEFMNIFLSNLFLFKFLCNKNHIKINSNLQMSNQSIANFTFGNSTINNTTVNNPNNNTANWLGFNKLVDGQTLMQLLSGYIVYIVALSVFNLILMHQQRKR